MSPPRQRSAVSPRWSSRSRSESRDAVHRVGVGLGSGPSQQLEPRQDVGEEVVVVLAPPRREDAHGAGDVAHVGQAPAQVDRVLRRSGHAVVRRQVEQERVVLGDDGPVGSQDASVAHRGHDVGPDVLAPVRGEPRVVGGQTRREGPVEIEGGGHLHHLDPTVGAGTRVVRRAARGVARRRRPGQAAGERADRPRGQQHARLEPGEERPQGAGEPRHLGPPSRCSARHLAWAAVMGSGRRPARSGAGLTPAGARRTGCGRSRVIQPTGAAGWRPNGAP